MNQPVVHYMKFGMTACLVNGPPRDWPANHKWSSDWAEVTCGVCLAGRELIHTYTISDDGKSITCLRCKRTSSNPNDVERHYCGHCHAFHDDLWPPARKAWIAGEMPTEIRIPNSAGELGKYDDDAVALVKRYQAAGAVVMIFGGTKGSGFSVSTINPALVQDLPAILRNMAEQIEREQKSK